MTSKYDRDFQALRHHVSTSYSGYREKLVGRATELANLTEALTVRAQRASDPAECTAILREWLAFFHDRHMTLADRTDPRVQRQLTPDDHRQELSLNAIDANTLLLRIPTFAPSLREPLNQLLQSHSADLESYKHLILDLRGNGGGADYVFHALIPLVYTQPIHCVGVDFWASRENAAHFRRFIESPDMPEEFREGLGAIVAQMDAHPDTMVPGIPDGTIELDTVRPRPERVGILIDSRCASTTEEFLLLARQSEKVTLLGDNSAGCLDYSNLRDIELPSGKYLLRLPMSRSRRLPDHPVDLAGIEPDVRIPDSVADPVRFARDYLASRD